MTTVKIVTRRKINYYYYYVGSTKFMLMKLMDEKNEEKLEEVTQNLE